jgi:hypothetical protein
MCNKHLLGEHGEIHKHRHNFVKRNNIAGRISPVVQIEPISMKARHDELAYEMITRGMNHQSPYEMPDISYLHAYELNARVDQDISRRDLTNRCLDCAIKMGGELTESQQVLIEGRA